MKKIIGIHWQGQYIECAIDNNNIIIDCFLNAYGARYGKKLNFINEYQILVEQELEKLSHINN